MAQTWVAREIGMLLLTGCLVTNMIKKLKSCSPYLNNFYSCKLMVAKEKSLTNMALGPQSRKSLRIRCQILPNWVPRAMFFHRSWEAMINLYYNTLRLILPCRVGGAVLETRHPSMANVHFSNFGFAIIFFTWIQISKHDQNLFI